MRPKSRNWHKKNLNYDKKSNNENKKSKFRQKILITSQIMRLKSLNWQKVEIDKRI